MKILISGHSGFHNKGCQALIKTTTSTLKQVFPHASFTIFSWYPEYDEANFNNDDIECRFLEHRFQTNEFSNRFRLWFFLNYYMGIRTDRVLWVKPSFYTAIKDCDLLVVSGGDILADYGEESIKHCFFPAAVAIALKKPVYIFAQSISPYKDNSILNFAKFFLNKASLITVREKISFEYLKKIGIKAPFYLTADPAFLLPTCSETRLGEILFKEGLSDVKSNIVGVSVSETATRWSDSDHQKFLGQIVETCDWIIEVYNAKIVFIPHVSYPNDPSNDDRATGKNIRALMAHKKDAYVIEGDYSCSELKAIISQCKLFIGARTHATIASASMFVPTIALAYSIKAFGIMDDILDKDTCVCDVRKLNAEELMGKVKYLFENQENIRREMKDKINMIKKRSSKNGELAKNILKIDESN